MMSNNASWIIFFLESRSECFQPRPQGPPREKLPTRASHAEGPEDEVGVFLIKIYIFSRI